MAILYTEAQVENAQLRAQIAMYEISQNIENGFYYMYSPVYQTYKTLQYDIYILFNIIGNENPYVTYNSTPSTYEYQFYELVGSLINKTKQFDVLGQFGGDVNPNYQPPAGTVVVVNEDFVPIVITKTQTDLIDAGGGNWYLPFLDNNNAALPSGTVPVSIQVNGVGISADGLDETFTPPRIFGFANNNTQIIVITAI